MNLYFKHFQQIIKDQTQSTQIIYFISNLLQILKKHLEVNNKIDSSPVQFQAVKGNSKMYRSFQPMQQSYHERRVGQFVSQGNQNFLHRNMMNHSPVGNYQQELLPSLNTNRRLVSHPYQQGFGLEGKMNNSNSWSTFQSQYQTHPSLYQHEHSLNPPYYGVNYQNQHQAINSPIIHYPNQNNQYDLRQNIYHQSPDINSYIYTPKIQQPININYSPQIQQRNHHMQSYHPPNQYHGNFTQPYQYPPIHNYASNQGNNQFQQTCQFQNPNPIIHFEQKQPQKSDIQLLINEIQETNVLISLFLQNLTKKNFSKHEISNYFDELWQRVILIQGIIRENYKIYEKDVSFQEKTVHYSQKLPYEKLFGTSFFVDKKLQEVGFKDEILIDYQDQFKMFLKVKDHFMRQLQRKDIQVGQKTNIKFSTQFCRDVFIRLIVVIRQFYHLNFLLKQRLNTTGLNKHFVQQRPQLPLLISDIIWHIQALRVLILNYQQQLRHLIQSADESSTLSERHQPLENTKKLCIELVISLEQILSRFLQETIVDSQDEKVYQQPSTESVWFFYYEYPNFNQQWIIMLLDTILQYEMIVGVGIENLLEFITKKNETNIPNQQLQKEPQKLNKDGNKNNRHKLNPQKLSNPKIKNNKKHKLDKAQCNKKGQNIPQQTVNNILSILSFLLFPHSSKNSNYNAISQLLQQPVRKMIVKEMKRYQSKLSSYQQDEMNNQQKKSLAIDKFLAIDKLTNIISFFTAKLSQGKTKSNQNDVQGNKRIRINHKKQNKKEKGSKKNHSILGVNSLELSDYDDNIWPSHIEHNDFEQMDKFPKRQPKEQEYLHLQEKDIHEQKFFIELKIMEMTLLARQMYDVLMSDNITGFEYGQQSQQKSLFQEINRWLRGMTIQSMIGLLFDKLMRRKLYQNDL